MSTEGRRFPRLWAHVVLAWGLVIHLVKRIFSSGGLGIEKFRENYGADGLLPAEPGDGPLLARVSACINCGICDALCPTVGAVPRHEWNGPSMAPLFLTRASAIAPLARDFLKHAARCGDCRTCALVCPAHVPIADAIALVRRRLSRLDAG